MAFTVSDFHDLIDLLREHPEWRAELRRQLLTEEILSLPDAVRELSRTVERLAQEFAASRIETDRRFQELAEAQRRTDAGMAELRQAVRELAEAQRRTEARVGRLEDAVAALAEAQRRTATELGHLSTLVGSAAEEEAEGVLAVVLAGKGYRLLGEASTLAWDGEIDVVLPVVSPDGEALWAVVEAKVRLSQRAVRVWAQRMRSPGWWHRLAKKGAPGPYLVYAYGIRADVAAAQEAEQQGIGLLTGQGERIVPRGVVRPHRGA